MTNEAQPHETTSAHTTPGFRLGDPGDVVIHAGPRLSPRLVSVPTRHSEHLIDLVAGDDLFDSVTGLLKTLDVSGLMVEFVAGEFGRIDYVYPAYGPDAERPMSFTTEFHHAGPAVLCHASATVGAKGGEPFAHIHASWLTEEGLAEGGHLLPGTLVGPNGMRLRVFALADAQQLSEADPETGFFAFAPTALHTPAAESAQGSVSMSESAQGSSNAVISRVRPGELIDDAIVAICREAGFDSAEVRASLGSTTGAVFFDGTAPWPAVEFTHLTGSVRGALGDDPRLRLDAEVVDVAGEVHAGQLVLGANPVAVTFELLVLPT
ncbi:DNA-binding protein [Brevibacterium zhoupengii]|uniref:DNA-binding protein n=1 Tax=Brevibacterium zhoupengii TaxID=2898795 RepID=UPI001E5A19A3|nr:DNA-binding protein [Brevibacterium zhoupengii]